MEKKTKIIIAVAFIIAAGLLILDGKLGEADCGSASYNQTTGECREGK